MKQTIGTIHLNGGIARIVAWPDSNGWNAEIISHLGSTIPALNTPSPSLHNLIARIRKAYKPEPFKLRITERSEP